MTTPSTATTSMLDLSSVKQMDDISCTNPVNSHDQVCFEAVPAVVCKAGCTKEEAKQICQHASGKVAEFRSSIALNLLKSLQLPIWVNPEADQNHGRFVSRVDDTYLHPDLNDQLWRDATGAKKEVGSIIHVSNRKICDQYFIFDFFVSFCSFEKFEKYI